MADEKNFECREECLALVKLASKVENMDHALNGNGEPGVVADVRFIREALAEMKGVDQEREHHRNKRDQEIKDALELHNADISIKLARRSMWASVAAIPIGIAGVMIAIFAILASVWLAHHAQLDPHDLLHRLKAGESYVALAETAGKVW